jgi:thiaminase
MSRKLETFLSSLITRFIYIINIEKISPIDDFWVAYCPQVNSYSYLNNSVYDQQKSEKGRPWKTWGDIINCHLSNLTFIEFKKK